MNDEPVTPELQIRRLQDEVDFYKSILFSSVNPQSASIINSLRSAMEIQDENTRLRLLIQGSGDLAKLCGKLEEENESLRKMLKENFDFTGIKD